MKAVATKQTRVRKQSQAQPDIAHEQLIREAAYFIYERSGCIAGREFENWLQAEVEFMQPLQAAHPKPKALRVKVK